MRSEADGTDTRGKPVSTAGDPAQDLNWLVTDFVGRVPDVAHAVIVSSDGLVVAVSAGFPENRAERLAAVTSGLASLVQGAAGIFEAGGVNQTVVEMDAGVLVVMTISHGASLAVLAGPDGKMGLIAYEMALLVERAGRMITPATRDSDRAAAVPSRW
jgi:predicted regulator of Ras-like GTPase activity (Roadblock/LC7/MglB family)